MFLFRPGWTPRFPPLRRGLLAGLPVVLDLAIRRDDIAGWGAQSWTAYAVSLLALAGWIVAAGQATTRWLPTGRGTRLLWVCGLALASGSLWVAQYTHYQFMGTLPNDATVRYIFSEPAEALSVARDSAGELSLAAIVAASLVFAAAWWILLSGRSSVILTRRRVTLGILALLLVSAASARLGSRFRGDLYPNVNLAAAVARTALSSLTAPRKPNSLRIARRMALEPGSGTQPVNVLLVVGESLRRDAFSAFGGVRPTSPKLDAFLNEFAGQVFEFPKFYSNATLTMASYPSILTGVAPGEPEDKLLSVPLIFQYGKVFANSGTFCISSHSYQMRRIDEFVMGPSLDELYTHETSGEPVYNSRGSDDRFITGKFKRWLAERDPARRFLGILHYNGTHMPYRVPEEFQVFDPRPRDPLNPNANWDDRRRYDEGVLYFDTNFGAVIDLLKRGGLLGNTVVIFTSDHAEMMGEHGHYGHTMRDTFYDEVLHIPFWIYLPPAWAARFGPALRENAPRNGSNLDIVPTVVDLLGLYDDPRLAAVVPKLLGQSLLRPIPAGRTFLAENWTGKQNAQPGLVLIHDSWRLVYHPGSARTQVAAYHVESDPGETRDLLPDVPQSVLGAAQAALAAQPVALHAEFSEKLALASSGSRLGEASSSRSVQRRSD